MPGASALQKRTPANRPDDGRYASSAAAVGTALRPFWTDLAKVDSKRVSVLFMGHSFVEGVHATSYKKYWSATLQTELRRRYNPTSILGGDGYLTFAGVTFATDHPLVNGLVGGTQLTGYGLGRKTYNMSAAGQKMIYTSVTCSDIDVYYVNFSTGGIGYYKIDGGTAVTFNTATGAGATPNGGAILPIRGLTAGSHTLEVGWSSGGPVFVNGAEFMNGDAAVGVHVYNSAYSGSKSSWFVDPAGGNKNWIDSVVPMQPSLVVICDLINDHSATAPAITAAQSKSNIQTLIANIRAVCAKAPSFVLVSEYAPNVPATNEPWSAYKAALTSIANADPGVLLYDMADRFGPGPFSASGTDLTYGDNPGHPTNAGMVLAGSTLAGFVSPR